MLLQANHPSATLRINMFLVLSVSRSEYIKDTFCKQIYFNAILISLSTTGTFQLRMFGTLSLHLSILYFLAYNRKENNQAELD